MREKKLAIFLALALSAGLIPGGSADAAQRGVLAELFTSTG